MVVSGVGRGPKYRRPSTELDAVHHLHDTPRAAARVDLDPAQAPKPVAGRIACTGSEDAAAAEAPRYSARSGVGRWPGQWRDTEKQVAGPLALLGQPVVGDTAWYADRAASGLSARPGRPAGATVGSMPLLVSNVARGSPTQQQVVLAAVSRCARVQVGGYSQCEPLKGRCAGEGEPACSRTSTGPKMLVQEK